MSVKKTGTKSAAKTPSKKSGKTPAKTVAKKSPKPPHVSTIVPGVKAPPFSLLDETAAPVSLSDFAGRRVVLFFFQKASTPGCTVEACEFRDLMPRFTKAGAVVLGISPDTWRRHAKFKSLQSLPYPLLADKDAQIAQAYDVWHQKLFWGRYYMGVVRSTFVIGPDGRIEQVWRDVHHEGHAEEVRAWLASQAD